MEKTERWSTEWTQQLELTEQAKQREEGGRECIWDNDAVKAAHLREQSQLNVDGTVRAVASARI